MYFIAPQCATRPSHPPPRRAVQSHKVYLPSMKFALSSSIASRQINAVHSTASFAQKPTVACHINYTVVKNLSMTNLRFEWDERKAAANAKKHGVSFEEARSVFVDERAKLIDDPDHSDDEDRFVLLGLSGALRLLLVCHCYRVDGNVIRIISARKASVRESRSYP